MLAAAVRSGCKTNRFHCGGSRKGFPAVLDIVDRLVQALHAKGPDASLDIDSALKREVRMAVPDAEDYVTSQFFDLRKWEEHDS